MKNKPILILFFIMFNFIHSIHSFSSQNLREEEIFDKNFSLVIARSTVLDMVSCGIDDERASKLSKALKGNSVVTQVYFQQNRIGNDGIKALGEAFETLPKLTQIYLNGNKFDNAGAINLFLSLKKVKSLSILDIRNNLFNDDVIPLLADLLKENPKLELYTSFSNFKQMFNT
jgi:Ran GTPase-activating protein (RanGAP) involved in mRNA processing and transport